MSSLVISGDTSGTVTVAAPAVAGTNTATLPVATGELSMLGGTGQTWQTFSVGSTRVNGTTYTNSTGKPIQVMILGNPANASNACSVVVGGVTVATANNGNTGGVSAPIAAIVPPGLTYSATGATAWTELR